MEQQFSCEAVEHSPVHISKQITHAHSESSCMLNTRVRTAGREAASANAQQLIPPCERAKHRFKHLPFSFLFLICARNAVQSQHLLSLRLKASHCHLFNTPGTLCDATRCHSAATSASAPVVPLLPAASHGHPLRSGGTLHSASRPPT